MLASVGGHFIGHAMEQDFLFLDFGIEPLMRDDRFARPLQDGFFRLERGAQPFEEQDRTGLPPSSRSLPVRSCSPRGSPPPTGRSARARRRLRASIPRHR